MDKRRTFVAIFLATVAAVFWQRHAETNDDRAYFAKDGHSYRVEIKGWRFPLVHDPLSLVLDRTYEETFTMELPRIDGIIDGPEIPVRPGKLGYVGSIVITRGKMKLDLYYDDASEGTRRALAWNDEYTLVQRDTGGTR